MPNIYRKPGELTAEEWDQLRGVFSGADDIVFALEELRTRKNIPQLRGDLFPHGKSRNCASEYANYVLRHHMIPFRIARIGTWAHPYREARFAVVRWTAERRQPLPLGLPKKEYRQYHRYRPRTRYGSRP